uniref:Nucleoporin_N domain-containing protein n=1 Tax=Macrostomum lignano TaxID=282301 RepID=A0A1I8FKE9_9PLAT
PALSGANRGDLSRRGGGQRLPDLPSSLANDANSRVAHQQQTPPIKRHCYWQLRNRRYPVGRSVRRCSASGAPGGDLIEEGLQFLEPFVQSERSYPDLATLLGGVGDRVTMSGTDVAAYPPSPNGSGGEVSISRAPTALMGVFPEASRAWLTVDNEFFLWNYEDGSDLAYYDGLQDAIVAVGFVQPRRDVFADEVHHLLCLATPLELAVLGRAPAGRTAVAPGQLMDSVVTCIEGSRSTGRLESTVFCLCSLFCRGWRYRRPGAVAACAAQTWPLMLARIAHMRSAIKGSDVVRVCLGWPMIFRLATEQPRRTVLMLASSRGGSGITLYVLQLRTRFLGDTQLQGGLQACLAPGRGLDHGAALPSPQLIIGNIASIPQLQRRFALPPWAASIDCQTPVPSSAAGRPTRRPNALLSGLSRYAARVLLPLWYSRSRLTEDERAHLRGTRFRDLLLAKNRLLLNRLIACLLEHYLADSASVDSISNKLQEACSSLYTPQDCPAANEMLQAAAGEPLDRRTSLLAEAGRLYREAGTSVSLADVLPRLEGSAGLRDYGRIVPGLGPSSGILRIAPLHFTREGRKPHTEADADAVAGRHGCYQALLDICTRLRRAATGAGAATVPVAVTPRPRQPRQQQLQPPLSRNRRPKRSRVSHEMARVLDNVIRVTLNSDDMLAHYEMFNWLSQHGMTEQMLIARIALPAFETLRQSSRGALEYSNTWPWQPATPLIWPSVSGLPGSGHCRRQESAGREGIGELLQQLEDELDTATVQAAVPRGAAAAVSAVGCLARDGRSCAPAQRSAVSPHGALCRVRRSACACRWPKLRIVASAGPPGPGAGQSAVREELLDRELAGTARLQGPARPILFQPVPMCEDFFPAVQIVATLAEARYRSPPRGGLGCQRVSASSIIRCTVWLRPTHQLLRRRAGDPVWQSLRGYHQLLRSLICLLANSSGPPDSMPA